jgi:hypothetical protein
MFGEGLEGELRRENASLQHAVKEVRSRHTIRYGANKRPQINASCRARRPRGEL